MYLSALTIVESLLLYLLFWTDDPYPFLMGVFFLGIPCFILWIFNIAIFIRCIRMRDKWQRCFVAWIIMLILMIPTTFEISEWYKGKIYSFVKIDLPDEEKMTVTYDKVIFGECEDTHNPQKDYIDLFDGCENYSITLTLEDYLYIWTESDSIPAKVHKLRYKVGKIYSNYDGKDEYMKAIVNKVKWKYDYYFMHDGIHSGGTQSLTTTVGDSLHVKYWGIYIPRFVGKRYSYSEEMTTYKEEF